MKTAGLLMIVMLTGCSTVDGLVGLRPDGTLDGNSPSSIAQTVLPSFGPWGTLLAGLIGAAGSTYGALRARKWRKATEGLLQGVEKVKTMKNGSGKIQCTVENLSEIFSSIMEANGSKHDVDKIIARIEDKK